MIVLDTNVILELARPAPNDSELAWIDAQADVAITATTVAELLYGIARLPDGARKSRLEDGISKMIDGHLRDRVLAFDHAAAAHYAQILAGRDEIGRPIAVADAQIAAICRAQGAVLGTRNVRDFESTGLTVVNPWDHQRNPDG